MLLFASDLDNTLIYSHRHDIGPDKVLAELYEGRAVSFMTRRSRTLLDALNRRAHFVPVSTRSIAQYQRIRFHECWTPALALVSNGGTLLVNGEPDAAWHAESHARIAPAEAALREAERVLEADPARMLDVRRVDGLFVFTKSADVPATAARLRQALASAPVEVFENGSKVYVLPHALDKGTALHRLRARFPQARTAAAGDSLFDLPLLAAADVACHPDTLPYEARPGQQALCFRTQDGVFSDQLLAALLTQADA